MRAHTIAVLFVSLVVTVSGQGPAANPELLARIRAGDTQRAEDCSDQASIRIRATLRFNSAHTLLRLRLKPRCGCF
jgi:hypothetical protein